MTAELKLEPETRKDSRMLNPNPTRAPFDKRLFGSRLKALRIGRGMTQGRMALRMHCKRTYMSKLERGVYRPNLAQVERLAAALNLSQAALLDFNLTPTELTANTAQERILRLGGEDEFVKEVRPLVRDIAPRDREMLLSLASAMADGRQYALPEWMQV